MQDWQASQEERLLSEQREQLDLKLAQFQQENSQLSADSSSFLTPKHAPSPGSAISCSHTLSPSTAPTSLSRPSFVSSTPAPFLPSQANSPAPVLSSSAQDQREEQPVSGRGKSFAQLLARKLAEEEAAAPVSDSGAEGEAGGGIGAARPFLRRGAGLARFNLSPDTVGRQRLARRGGAKSTVQQQQRRDSSSSPPSKLSLRPPPTRHQPQPQLPSPPQLQHPPRQSPVIRRNSPTSPPTRPAPAPPSPRPRSFNLCDSVENSFCDRLAVQAGRQERDGAELAVFQRLEEAADDTSFCSESSRVQVLVSHAVLPSPARSRSQQQQAIPHSFVSSTPASAAEIEARPVSRNKVVTFSEHTEEKLPPTEDNSGLGESLMLEVKQFLQSRLPSQQQKQQKEEEADKQQQGDDSEWTDESSEEEDTTLGGEVSIGRDWRQAVQTSHPTRAGKENRGEMLSFSPPERRPPNPPSNLIWEVFGRENERKRQQQVSVGR